MATRQDKHPDAGDARAEPGTSSSSAASTSATGASAPDAEQTIPMTSEGTSSQAKAATPQRRGAFRPALPGWPSIFRGGMPASPWALMMRMSEEMNQLMESLGASGAGVASPAQAASAATGQQRAAAAGTDLTTPTMWVPQIEVLQRPGELKVRADLPGLKPDDINVTVEDRLLTISGERRQEQREEHEGFVRAERIYGTFYRTIPLPDGADENNVSATFRNGVLEITVPVAEQERGRQVKVQS